MKGEDLVVGKLYVSTQYSGLAGRVMRADVQGGTYNIGSVQNIGVTDAKHVVMMCTNVPSSKGDESTFRIAGFTDTNLMKSALATIKQKNDVGSRGVHTSYYNAFVYSVYDPTVGQHVQKFVDDIMLEEIELYTTCHTNIKPFNGTYTEIEGMSSDSREQRAVLLERKLENAQNKLESLRKDVTKLETDCVSYAKEIARLRQFKDDEEELAHLMHELLTKKDQLSVGDIADLLRARASTNKL